MVVVVAVDVVGVTVLAIILVMGPDGVPRLYVRPLLLACMPCHPPAKKQNSPTAWRFDPVDHGGHRDEQEHTAAGAALLAAGYWK